LAYIVAGAVLGAVAGAIAAAAVNRYLESRWWAIGLFALAGALAASAGAVASRSRRAALRDGALGFILAGLAFYTIPAVQESAKSPGTSMALGLVIFTVLFSAAVGASHALSLREISAVIAAALFGGTAGLLALAIGMKVLSAQTLVMSFASAGAMYGGMLWYAIGLARRFFSVDVGQFRV
jgi:hypothetical protein